MFRLAHLSDVHLGPLPEITYGQLASKRMLGYVNWHRNRRQFLHDHVIDAILADIKAAKTDHIAVTGDLVNIALDIEIDMARQWLEAIGAPRDVSVVPGNHDAYVPGALDKACRAWGAFMSSDGANAPFDSSAFPYLRVRERVALIGVSSASATAPFMANGFFRDVQADRLRQLLDEAAARELFRVVMIHHPPLRKAVSQHKRLYGIRRFQRVIREHGAELVLHGHSHLPTAGAIEGPAGCSVPVIGVSAAGQGIGGRHPAAQWNLFEISGKPGRWSVKLARRGLTGATTPVGELASAEL